ncbi:Fic family protein [Schaalia sp. 19OD2882]|uniref:Fic family protein n=1 Tax=Schaalia sp. 19OD2882 TaxID=2794089 RepID=UPI0020A8173C|nr:Fic family protein [Schaalia sp. 19OD2882]
MKTPVPPPGTLQQMQEAMIASTTDRAHTLDVLTSRELASDPEYHPWEWFFRHDPPEGFTREEWWIAVRGARAHSARPLPFQLTDGTPLTFNLADPLLHLIDQTSARARGQIQIPEPIANPTTRNGYLVRSLIEESMTSSQLEGAATTRVEAKRMLREKRPPRDRSERMIANNYRAMTFISESSGQPLTPDLVLQIHALVTKDTLEDPADAGRLQQPDDVRVRIVGDLAEDQILHVPPPAEQLPERLEALCAFANGDLDQAGPYVPPLVRAIALHFMMGHDHYFADGNGRTARAVFYWSMLSQGFFLTEYLSISRLLLRAPARYARSFLLTEQDEGDLTHFLLEQAHVIDRALDDLDTYLAAKSQQISQVARLLRTTGLNHRQITVLESFIQDPGASVTVAAHQDTHRITPQTARSDLQELERQGYVVSVKQGRRVVWFPCDNLASRIQSSPGG